ncbi:MAG: PDZ domain-containing protein, partial [Bacteroidales bacterium]|nr:PDZ domain-containing protein [Bacteroidales bacterium]
MKRFFTIAALLSAFVAAQAQSANFVIGQSLDIQNTILQQLSANYVDTIKFDKLLKTGIDAMLSSLDPYTQYFPEELEEDVEMMTTGMYGGVGSLIKKRPGGGVLITEPYPNTPATKAGLHPGDTIFWIDGKYVYDETADQSSARMKGVAGTNVTFKVIKGGSRDTST